MGYFIEKNKNKHIKHKDCRIVPWRMAMASNESESCHMHHSLDKSAFVRCHPCRPWHGCMGMAAITRPVLGNGTGWCWHIAQFTMNWTGSNSFHLMIMLMGVASTRGLLLGSTGCQSVQRRRNGWLCLFAKYTLIGTLMICECWRDATIENAVWDYLLSVHEMNTAGDRRLCICETKHRHRHPTCNCMPFRIIFSLICNMILLR